jgi:hypothetical protein
MYPSNDVNHYEPIVNGAHKNTVYTSSLAASRSAPKECGIARGKLGMSRRHKNPGTDASVQQYSQSLCHFSFYTVQSTSQLPPV